MSFGETNYDSFQTLSDANVVLGSFAQIFFFVCMILATILLFLNILIAMMGNTFSRVLENAEDEWRWQRAYTILSLEANLTDLDKEKLRPKNHVKRSDSLWMVVEEKREKWLHYTPKYVVAQMPQLGQMKGQERAVERYVRENIWKEDYSKSQGKMENIDDVIDLP